MDKKSGDPKGQRHGDDISRHHDAHLTGIELQTLRNDPYDPRQDNNGQGADCAEIIRCHQ